MSRVFTTPPLARATGIILLGIFSAGSAMAQIDPVQQAYLKAGNAGTEDEFGYSVAISGDTAIVGARSEDSNGTAADNSRENSGAAYVYVRSGSSWTLQAYLKASTPAEGDQFGWSVAISGDTAVIGAISQGGSGAAYVFTRSGTAWSQQAILKAADGAADDLFGGSVGISGNTAVVGAWGQDEGDLADSGTAYVFTRSGSSWAQQAVLRASNAAAGDNFAYSVAITGDSVICGAPYQGGEEGALATGAAYVFSRTGTTWAQQAFLKAAAPVEAAAFGWAVSLAGGSAVIGAPYENLGQGAAYVFVIGGAGWSQQARLQASNGESGDCFGWSTGLSGEVAVIGAQGEQSSSTGVGGSGANNGAPGAGAAYVFSRSGTAWSQASYLKASNTDAFDSFGSAVAVAGDLAISGAPGEASNGTASNNSLAYAGAAYTFDLGVISTPVLTQLETWRLRYFETSSNSGVAADSADPDEDGRINLLEFALDGNPLRGNLDGKLSARLETLSGSQYLVLTVPMLQETVFPNSANLVSNPIQGFRYSVEGGTTLVDFSPAAVVAYSGTPPTGLPALSEGWEYRRFRLSTSITVSSAGFLRATIIIPD